MRKMARFNYYKRGINISGLDYKVGDDLSGQDFGTRLIAQVVSFCNKNTIEINLCRFIDRMDYNKFDPDIQIYIDYLKNSIRFGIGNDILLMACSNTHLGSLGRDFTNAGFIPIDFISMRYEDNTTVFAYENDFVRMLIAKSNEG